jgi:3-deoxy-D-manno-octulosonic-acid transferase
VLVAHGKPFFIPKEMELDQAKQKIQSALHSNEQVAEQMLRQSPSWFSDLIGSTAFFIYSVAALALAPLVALAAAGRYGFKRGTQFLGERFSAEVPDGMSSPLWFHVASVGEWQALKPVLAQLRRQFGDRDIPLAITVNTPEARRLVANEQPGAHVRMVPVDIAPLTSAWCRKLKPNALVVVETELWPNLLLSAARHWIPIFIINGRLSERSYRRWRWFGPLIRHLLCKVNAVCARTQEDADRFEKLGMSGERLHVTGNCKVDNVDAIRTSAVLSSRVPILIGGSTWPGEEQLLISVAKELGQNKVRLVIAPRRLERVDSIRQLLRSAELTFSNYSEISGSDPWRTEVLVVDTFGDLKKLYSSAQLAFVGGSLYPHGGQNPLEPAAVGVPMVFGPSMSNFRAEAEGLSRAGAAFRGQTGDAIRGHLIRLMRDEAARRSAGAAAEQYIKSNRGASARTMQQLGELLGNK